MAKRVVGGRRYARLIQIAFLSAAVIGVVYFVVWMVGRIISPAAEAQCMRNLQVISRALSDYLEDHNNQWPRYLTELYPRYIQDLRRFQCPADRTRGAGGAVPEWIQRRLHFDNEDRFVDLDGPNMTPEDEDTIPCSYLYEYNQYPCFLSFAPGVKPFQLRWSDFKDFQIRWVRERGLDARNVVPVVRCLHHLKEADLPEEELRRLRPTLNILLNLSPNAREYPYDWHQEYPPLSPPEP